MTSSKNVNKSDYICPMRPANREGFYKKTGEKNKYGPICGRLVKTRKEMGLTQAEFCGKLNVGLSALKAIERGYFAPTLEVIMRWHKISGRSLNWIFYGKD